MPEKTNIDPEVASLSYEQAFAMLEQTVERMGAAAVPLDELLALYERGMELGAHCEQLLKGYEARLERVSERALLKELDPLEESDDEPPFDGPYSASDSSGGDGDEF